MLGKIPSGEHNGGFKFVKKIIVFVSFAVSRILTHCLATKFDDSPTFLSVQLPHHSDSGVVRVYYRDVGFYASLVCSFEFFRYVLRDIIKSTLL